ncbi:MAG: hypothetical protein MUP11_04065 [Anaerolineales bacterium]|nr:hypothetical protein [Anaerolineales bacterium]
MSSNVDLVKLFSTVADTLVENQASLNKADEYNQNHGDNMVDIFKMITGAVKEAPAGNVTSGLSKASELLTNKQSGSAAMYAKGLAQAAEYFQGQDLDATQLMPLLQTMLGGGEASVSKGAGGLLDSLVGSIGGEDGLDLGDILSAGAAFMQSKQAGESNLEAAIDAVISSSKMGETPHRAQSSKLVADVLLQTLMSKMK